MIATVKAHGETPGHDALFHIERNKNANIVQYDARIGPDGLLHPKEPVAVYWVRLAEQGQTRQLTWLQKKFAFGVKLKLNRDTNTATLKLAVDIGRPLLIKQIDEDYRAIAQINGVDSYVDSLFIHASGKGISTRVNYIELFGHSVETQEEQYERFSH
jgi:hypothetical protein